MVIVLVYNIYDIFVRFGQRNHTSVYAIVQVRGDHELVS